MLQKVICPGNFLGDYYTEGNSSESNLPRNNLLKGNSPRGNSLGDNLPGSDLLSGILGDGGGSYLPRGNLLSNCTLQ